MRIRLAAIVVAFLVIPALAQDAARPASQSSAALLAAAARANDFTTFDNLYRTSPNTAFRPLHELWTYSVTDPGGAFYGADMFARFSAAYPSFAAAISTHRIVDSRGNVFYPSAETRAFLLAQAERGTVAARSTAPEAPRPSPVAPTPNPATAGAPEPRTTTPPAPVTPTRAQRKTFKKASLLEPAVTPAVVHAALRSPVQTHEPVAVRTAESPVTSASVQTRSGGRGLLLVIVGLIGTGVLALIVRTPPDLPSARNQ